MIPIFFLAAVAAASPAPACGGPEPAAALCMALAASDENRFADSAAAFERAAAASPASDPRTQRMLAAAGNMWIAAGQPGKAALALDRALAGAGLQAEQRGLALLDRARAAEAQGDLVTARRFVTQATPSASDDHFLWYFSASLAMREGDLPTARVAIARALALAPRDPAVLFEAGHVAAAEGDQPRARNLWQQALDGDPSGATGAAARQALGIADVPLAVGAATTTAPQRKPK